MRAIALRLALAAVAVLAPARATAAANAHELLVCADYHYSKASPDGHLVAYWSPFPRGRRAPGSGSDHEGGRAGPARPPQPLGLTVQDVTTGADAFTVEADDSDAGAGICNEVVWSPDSKRIAFSTDVGMAVLDVTTQKVTVVDPAGSCTFTFRSDGVLFYVKSGGITATLWREGSLHPVMRLPDASYHVLAEPEASGTPGAEPRLVVVSVSQTLDAVNVRPEKKHGVLLWATAADEKVPRLLVRSAPREHAFLENAPSPTLAVSPGNRRACLARLPSGIFCLDLRTNTAVVIAPDVVVSGLAYVHGDAAFSPSGTRLAFNGSRVGLPGESVFVHDFASSATREVDAGFYDSRKREYAAIQYVWQDDEHLIESAIRPDQIVSFDVATGARRVLWHRASGAPHVYFLHPTPGHPSIVYANRDKADLVRIATP